MCVLLIKWIRLGPDASVTFGKPYTGVRGYIGWVINLYLSPKFRYRLVCFSDIQPSRCLSAVESHFMSENLNQNNLSQIWKKRGGEESEISRILYFAFMSYNFYWKVRVRKLCGSIPDSKILNCPSNSLATTQPLKKIFFFKSKGFQNVGKNLKTDCYTTNLKLSLYLYISEKVKI